ncbi:hypothetical protein Q0V21_25180 [Paenibacillus sp. 11B]|nr:hypothetical protein [Paenibacillus sp. 11B]MDN8592044.1 hypothetical protein [Paenibacillus sp. 11B]
MRIKPLPTTAILIYLAVVFFAVVFLIVGTNDINELAGIFEKITTINFALAIGYSALLAAIASLASHNTRQNNQIKNDILSFIYITVFYVLVNLIVVMISFILDEFYSALIGRVMVGILIVILVVYSHLLLKTLKQLIY